MPAGEIAFPHPLGQVHGEGRNRPFAPRGECGLELADVPVDHILRISLCQELSTCVLHDHPGCIILKVQKMPVDFETARRSRSEGVRPAQLV